MTNAMKPLTLFLLALTFASQGWGQVQMDRIAPKGVGGIIYADSLTGSDSGAKINSAVALWQSLGGTCHIYLTKTGTVSTAPVLPAGCHLDIFAAQTQSVTWPIQHHGVVIDFHGNPITFTGGTGVHAFDVGKASATVASVGHVNTNGTTVTWVDGPLFDFDNKDQINIGTGTYNVASVQSTTQINLTASAGVQSGVQYVGILIPENGVNLQSSQQSDVLRNLVLIASSASGDAVRSTFVSDLKLEEPHIYGAFALGFEARGSITATISNYLFSGNGVLLNQLNFGGFTSGANDNRFLGGDTVQATTNPGGNNAWSFLNSSNNQVIGGRWEGNLTRQAWYDQGGNNNGCFGCYFDRNGDGTSASNTFNPNGSTNSYLVNTTITDAGTGFNNGGNAIAVSGSATALISNVTINGNSNSFSAGVHCFSTSPVLINNSYVGSFSGGSLVGCGSAGIIDNAGNATLNAVIANGILSTNGAFTTGASGGDVVIRNGHSLYVTSNANNALVNAVTTSNDSNNTVIVDSLGNGTKFGSSGTAQITAGSIIANNQIKPAQKTVSGLPAAGSSAGFVFVVTDSTAVSSEGQTCTGGSSNTALAFSNGSTWKCF